MTTTTNLQTSPYLREQRQFPNEDLDQLARQMDHAYIDIASKVNLRTIGLFATNFAVITGERWFISGQPQQTLRRLYVFNTAVTTIPHGLNFATFPAFTRFYGQFTDGTNWYGLIAGSNVAIAGEVSFYVSPTNIVILSGAGAPTISSGSIILEWLSFV